ncbi:hypothetical protein [Streptomyces shaanxiensis]|uniref:hypothetical protein n=1 Tax=Streptomyces shaanxiensis TaxID=653357 RepID=UPI0031E567F6
MDDVVIKPLGNGKENSDRLGRGVEPNRSGVVVLVANNDGVSEEFRAGRKFAIRWAFAA